MMQVSLSPNQCKDLIVMLEEKIDRMVQCNTSASLRKAARLGRLLKYLTRELTQVKSEQLVKTTKNKNVCSHGMPVGISCVSCIGDAMVNYHR